MKNDSVERDNENTGILVKGNGPENTGTDLEEQQREDENIMKILVASDVHLGYKETDRARDNDSFATFEEVFAIAMEKNADFILLGGDLFHKKRPSVKTLHKCMEIMRKYCLGHRPCQVKVLSDEVKDFGHTSKTITRANYNDECLKIGMPVFSIHGNHDDPFGNDGPSAIDLLSVAGVLNHFGRVRNEEEKGRKFISIAPVLLSKGSTKIALYGLGARRDERLHRLFLNKNVNFLRPNEGTEEFYNIMVIHQNRAKRGETNYIPEAFLEDFLDLVVWGHEHDCRLDGESCTRPFTVLQPGSTVATSLKAGESKKKNAVFLQINGRDMVQEFITLKTVRSMYVEDVVLKNLSCFQNPVARLTEHEIQEHCEARVNAIIGKAQLELNGHPERPKLPLIRLRVDSSGGFPTFNPYRLAAKFTEQVANPDSIVHFLKKSTDRVMREQDSDTDTVVKLTVEEVLEELLSNEEKYKMSLLCNQEMNWSVREYVRTGENDAIKKECKRQITKVEDHLKKCELPLVERNDILDEIEILKEASEAAADVTHNPRSNKRKPDVAENENTTKRTKTARGDKMPSIASHSHPGLATSSVTWKGIECHGIGHTVRVQPQTSD